MSEKEFISSWKLKLESGNLKNFPGNFVNAESFKELRLPAKTLVMGEEFFGTFEILTVDGNPVHQASTYAQAKYILYANRNKPEVIPIPADEDAVKKANSNYETYLDSLIKDIEKDYKKNFPAEKNSKSITNEIFRLLNLTRY